MKSKCGFPRPSVVSIILRGYTLISSPWKTLLSDSFSYAPFGVYFKLNPRHILEIWTFPDERDTAGA